MPLVAGTFIPGSNSATGLPISNTSLVVSSIDIIALPSNNANSAPNIGGSNSACLWPTSWSKPATGLYVDLSKIFVTANNNTDGICYLYSTP